MKGQVTKTVRLEQCPLIRGILPVDDECLFNQFTDFIYIVRKKADHPGAQNVCQIVQMEVFVPLAGQLAHKAVFGLDPVLNAQHLDPGVLHQLCELLVNHIAQGHKVWSFLPKLLNDHPVLDIHVFHLLAMYVHALSTAFSSDFHTSAQIPAVWP